ncbi:flavin reductase family protein [Ramlibacter sp. AN1015]|uniref:flavin reductase family protein n=1 Tax=Ramlibacter sp. AN1015 TaxID=3133428 RepID=UPI0030C0FC97
MENEQTPWVDSASYRQAMRKVPSAVAVVTAEHEGRRRGLTATAVCSVSADPPQVLACVNKDGRAHCCIAQASAFGINYLAESQIDLALAFSRPVEDADQRFQEAEWDPGIGGVPLLRGALVSFACRVVQTVDCGTHTIFVGEILQISQQDQRSLLYKSGEFIPA